MRTRDKNKVELCAGHSNKVFYISLNVKKTVLTTCCLGRWQCSAVFFASAHWRNSRVADRN